MLHFPILRAGQPYESLRFLEVRDFRTGEKLAELSQANSGLIGKDFHRARQNKQEAWAHDHRVQIHGPGWSKVLLGNDVVDNWQQYQQTIVDSILINSGRSCLNASSVWLPTRGREIAEALAKTLAAVPARAMDDPQVQFAAFVNPALSE